MRAALVGGLPEGDGELRVLEAGAVLPVLPASEVRNRPRRQRLGRAALAVERDTKVSIGGWQYTGRFDDLARLDASGAPIVRHGASGAYAIAEQVLYRDAALLSRRLRVFGQLGAGDERSGRFSRYRSVGVTFAGPRTETALELTYLIALRGWLSLQPSLQRIRHPGGAPTLPDATVGLLRFELSL